MDKIGEANKSIGQRVMDWKNVKNEKEESSTIVSEPKDVDVIDRSAFLKTKKQYGLDRVFWLVDPVLPGEKMPVFLCPGLMGEQEELFTSETFAGKTLLIFFYPKDFGAEGEACLDLMANLAASPVLDAELVAVSTDSVAVHRVWRERRDVGGPGVMLGDTTGALARSFGVLDTTTHCAYSALFVVDKRGIVQVRSVFIGQYILVVEAVEVSNQDSLGLMAGEVLELVEQAGGEDGQDA